MLKSFLVIPDVYVWGFFVLLIILTVVGIVAGARSLLRSFPEFNLQQRQTLALFSLALGEVILTGLWVGLYGFEWAMHAHFDLHAELTTRAQEIIWQLMIAHVIAIAFIAIGDVVSAKVGDFFEFRRGGYKDVSD